MHSKHNFYDQRFGKWLNKQGHTQTHIPTHTPRLPCWPGHLSVRRHEDTVDAVWRDWPRSRDSPEHSNERLLAGWTVAGKQAKQQTTPARNNSNRKKGLTSVIISPTILSQFVNTRKPEYVSAESRSAEAITVFRRLLQGSALSQLPVMGLLFEWVLLHIVFLTERRLTEK